MSDKQNQIGMLWAELKETLRLNLDYAKLSVAEKMTLLLTAMTFGLLGLVLVSLIMFFISLAVVRLIAVGTGMMWAYFIMAAFYVVILVLVVVMRKQWIINPISRFVSRLFFKP